MRAIRSMMTLILIAVCSALSAQNPKHIMKLAESRTYPASFSIQKNEFDDLFLYNADDEIASRTNNYLNKATLLTNTKKGDQVSLKIKLGYFKNALFLVQVKGLYSTRVFITSEDKTIFYKGRFEKNELIMDRCSESDIALE